MLWQIDGCLINSEWNKAHQLSQSYQHIYAYSAIRANANENANLDSRKAINFKLCSINFHATLLPYYLVCMNICFIVKILMGKEALLLKSFVTIPCRLLIINENIIDHLACYSCYWGRCAAGTAGYGVPAKSTTIYYYKMICQLLFLCYCSCTISILI